MRLYFMISRNNGLTWTRAYDIASTSYFNRGFSTMALDQKTGNLYFGWYDGRKGGQHGENLQYYGAHVASRELDKLVDQIPYSDPLFYISEQGQSEPPKPDQ
jgi:hypothetical protein